MFVLLALCCAGAARVAALAAGPIVTTPNGKVQGFVLNGTAAWRGIPYAAPPLAAKRFSPPFPAQQWDGVKNTTLFGGCSTHSARPQTVATFAETRYPSAPHLDASGLYADMHSADDVIAPRSYV